MKETTFEMLEVCGRWRGAFSRYMLSVARNCENYDASYAQISSHLTSMKNDWSELKNSTEEHNRKKKEYYSQMRQENQVRMTSLNNRRSSCPRLAVPAEKRAKHSDTARNEMLTQPNGDNKNRGGCFNSPE